MTFEEMKDLKDGDKVDALDRKNLWGQARVYDVSREGLSVHFDGFKKSYDEKFTWRDFGRLAKKGSVVRGPVMHQKPVHEVATPSPTAKKAKVATTKGSKEATSKASAKAGNNGAGKKKAEATKAKSDRVKSSPPPSDKKVANESKKKAEAASERKSTKEKVDKAAGGKKSDPAPVKRPNPALLPGEPPRKRGRPSNAELAAREEKRKREAQEARGRPSREAQEPAPEKEAPRPNPLLGFFLPAMKAPRGPGAISPAFPPLVSRRRLGGCVCLCARMFPFPHP